VNHKARGGICRSLLSCICRPVRSQYSQGLSGRGVTHHLRKTSSRDNVAGVDKTVEVAGGLLDLFAHVVFAVEVEDICDKIEGVLVVLDFGVEASKIEAVSQVFFVDLAEVFVAAG
jgi:hypothetical protein